MSVSPTGVIPEELMRRNATTDVMQFLAGLHIVGDLKVDYFMGWARAVGVKVSGSQRERVRESGTDRHGPRAS
jgi:hypothetical protein